MLISLSLCKRINSPAEKSMTSNLISEDRLSSSVSKLGMSQIVTRIDDGGGRKLIPCSALREDILQQRCYPPAEVCPAKDRLPLRSSQLVPSTNVNSNDTISPAVIGQRSEGAEPATPAPMIWNCLRNSRSEPRGGRNTMTVHQPSQNPNRKLIEAITIRLRVTPTKSTKGAQG